MPWAIDGRKVNLEIEKAIPFLNELINLLSKLEVVVCMGVNATNGWNQAYPNNMCIPGWNAFQNPSYSSIIALTCPHPSGQSVDGYHPPVNGLTPSERIEKTLANGRSILDKKTFPGIKFWAMSLRQSIGC